MSALIDIAPTIQFPPDRTNHGYKLDLQGQRIIIVTRCGLPATDLEYTIALGIVSCPNCLAP